MRLLSRCNVSIAVETNYTRQLKRSIAINTFRFENIGSFEAAGEAGDGDGNHKVRGLVGGGKRFNGEGLAIGGNDWRWLISYGRGAGCVQRRERAAVGQGRAQQRPSHSGIGWVVRYDG